jgi:uncharacterized protein (TIGR00661 family)
VKILYGVCGEGMGHAMRSAVVGRHLLARGHQLEFICGSGRAFDYLEKSFGKVVHRTVGPSMVMRGNAVRPVATIAFNLLQQAVASPFAHIGTLLAVRRPDLVVSDFEPLSARYAGATNIPLLALDNIHFMNRFDHLAGITGGDRGAAALMFAATSEMVPDADRYMVTSFVEAKPRLSRTTIHLPILRDEILRGEKTVGDHVVVYLNDKSDASGVLRTLRQIPEASFKAYCGRPEDAGGNVQVLPFSERGFLRDFLSSRAVIGGAGFTLMTEAIYSGKPMLALPFEGQFEQILNANYLQRLGWGERARGFTPEGVRWFLSRSDGYREKLSGLKHDGNQELLSAVDGWIRRWST